MVLNIDKIKKIDCITKHGDLYECFLEDFEERQHHFRVHDVLFYDVRNVKREKTDMNDYTSKDEYEGFTFTKISWETKFPEKEHADCYREGKRGKQHLTCFLHEEKKLTLDDFEKEFGGEDERI